LWAAYEPGKLSTGCIDKLSDKENTLLFASASIWEISVKAALGSADFAIDVIDFLRGLRMNDYTEIAVTSDHAIVQMGLPMLHKDPFDRMLIAQAATEKACLLTTDADVLRYEGPLEQHALKALYTIEIGESLATVLLR